MQSSQKHQGQEMWGVHMGVPPHTLAEETCLIPKALSFRTRKDISKDFT